MPLIVITGPMRSGKTAELIRQVSRYDIAGYTCLVLKSTLDKDRFKHCESHVVSRNKQRLECRLSSRLCRENIGKNVDLIAIDEGQFFPDLLEFAEMHAESKIVLVSVLSGTANRAIFPYCCREIAGGIQTIFTLADKIIHLTAICQRCREIPRKSAAFTAKLRDYALGESPIEVGNDIYHSVCRKCYLKLEKKE